MSGTSETDKPSAPRPLPSGGGTLPDGSTTNDPAVWSRWVKEYTADSPKPVVVGSPKAGPPAESAPNPMIPEPTPIRKDSGFATNLGPTAATVKYAGTPEEVAKIPGGSMFRWTDGQIRKKPYDVTDDKSYQAVPLGDPYIEKGQLKTKFTADGGLDPRAQTLYDMAHTAEGQKKALEYIYGPGSVHDDRGELYVMTRAGQKLSPKATTAGGVASRVGGAVVGGALPAIGSGVGAMAGAIPGLASGPVGATAAGLAGSAAGGAAGEGANQAILRALGIENLDTPRALGEMGTSAVVGAAGNVIGAVPGAVRATIKDVAGGLPAALRWYTNYDPVKGAMMQDVVKQGGRPSVLSYANIPFARFMTSLARQFGHDPVRDAAKTWLQTTTGKALADAGVAPADRAVVGLTSGVSTEPAGAAAVARARQILGAATDKLSKTVRDFTEMHRGALAGDLKETTRNIATTQTALVTEADTLRAAATRVLGHDLQNLEHETTAALKLAGAKPGDLSRSWGDGIMRLRAQLSADADKAYAGAGALAEGHAPVITDLKNDAAGLIESVPPAVSAFYPREVGVIAKLAGRKAETPPASALLDQYGSPLAPAAVEDAPVSFSDLHRLRTFLRSNVDWGDLTRTPKQGIIADLAAGVNRVLYDAEAGPELQAAAKALRETDTWYSENIRRFEDTTVRQLARFGREAAPPDVAELAKLVLRDGNTERVRMLREMGGPELWQRVVAADTQAMLNEAGARTGRLDAQTLAGEILDRAKSGVLQEAYTPAQAQRLRLMADRISRVYGRVPMEMRPGDTVMSMVQRSDDLIRQAQSLASKKPMELFKASMAQVNAEAKALEASGRADIAHNPLRALTNLGAEEASKTILKSPDLIRAVYDQFGADSAEFTMLRQTFLRGLLQDVADAIAPSLGRVPSGLEPISKAIFALSPETQARLFPGTTKDQVINLLNQAIVMFPNDMKGSGGMGAALAGTALIAHPSSTSLFGSIAGHGLRRLPNFIARPIIDKGLQKISMLASSPQLLAFLAQGLDGKPPGEEAAKEVLRAFLSGSGRFGGTVSAAGQYGNRQTNYVSGAPAEPFDDKDFVPWDKKFTATPPDAPAAENPPGFVPWKEKFKATP